MNIVETFTFTVGKYRVIQRPRFDSPGWGQYCVYLGDVLIGKCFSVPDVGACEWLEREQRAQTGYAYSNEKLPELTGVRRGKAWRNYAEPWNKKQDAADLADAVES